MSVKVFLAALVSSLVTVCLSQEPKLIILPEGPHQIKAIGANIVLTCKAQVPEPELISQLKWLGPDGRELPASDRIFSEKLEGEAGQLLFIKGLQEFDSGNYTCEAVYTSSQRLSATVKLATIVGITWEDAPAAQSAVFGKAYKVRCVVRANPPATIDWVKNGQILTTNDRYIIENDGVLIREVSLEDDTFFTCRARVPQTGQLEERRIRVEVFIPPEFSKEPRNTTVTEDETATLECQATGKPDPTYTWVDRNNQNVKGRERYFLDERTGRLTITEAKRTDAGEFKCLVENDAGKASRSATLRVVLKPQITELINVTGVINKETSLTCKAFGDPLPEIMFVKEGSRTPFVTGVQTTDDRIIVETGTGADYAFAKMTIRNLLRTDDGLYACIAKNQGGNVTKNGHVVVEFPPSFANTPMREAWSWNQHIVNLTCRAESIPNATITWYFNGRLLSSTSYYNIQAANGESSLAITPIDTSFYGIYYCQARNVHGEAEHQISLREARAPGPLLQVKFETVTATTITFNFVPPVDNGGLPVEAFAVQYKLAGSEWTEKPLQRVWSAGAQNHYDLHEPQQHAPVDMPYVLENLEPETAYIFRFAAKNQVGFGSWENQQSYTMPKRAEPQQPIILAKPGLITSPYPDRYELLWTAPPDNGEPIDYFELTYYTAKNTTSVWTATGPLTKTQIPYPGVVKFEMKNLVPESYYRIELRAHNVIGFSQPAEVTLRTAKGSADDEQPVAIAGNVAIIVGVLVAVVFVVVVAVDVSCYCVNRTGLTNLICEKLEKKPSTKKQQNGSYVIVERGISSQRYGDEEIGNSELSFASASSLKSDPLRRYQPPSRLNFK